MIIPGDHKARKWCIWQEVIKRLGLLMKLCWYCHGSYLARKKIKLNLACIISPEHSFIKPLKAEGFINSWPGLSWRHFSLVWQNCPLKQSARQAAPGSHFQQTPAGASYSPTQADCQDLAHKMAHLSRCNLGLDGQDPDPCPSLLTPFTLLLELSHREQASCPRSHKFISTASPSL